MTPEDFSSVGEWYEDFTQTTDQEVRSRLQDAQARNPPP
jgi:predicted phosphoribosyltransferase